MNIFKNLNYRNKIITKKWKNIMKNMLISLLKFDTEKNKSQNRNRDKKKDWKDKRMWLKKGKPNKNLTLKAIMNLIVKIHWCKKAQAMLNKTILLRPEWNDLNFDIILFIIKTIKNKINLLLFYY
jgi:hypothetical protein